MVRTLRIKNGLSEKNFAEKVGKSQSYISAIESKDFPFLTFDFVSACMDVFGLEKEERHVFIVKAMKCSVKMSVLLHSESFVPKERFLKILAYILDNYYPTFNSNQSWVANVLYAFKHDETHTILNK